MSDKPIFFSWEKITKNCNYNVYKILDVFKSGKYRQFDGYSFLLNPKPLLSLHSSYDAEVVEYISLASVRNYFDAEYLHNARLSVYYVDSVNLNKLKENRLLKIVGKEILFLYEEIYGNQVWGSSR